MDALRDLDAARRALEAGATPTDLLEAAGRRRSELDADGPALHAFLSTREDPAGGDGEPGGAPGAGTGSAAGPPATPLEGVPVAVKDNLCTPELPTTCGSRMLEGYRSPYPATVVRRLEGAGARVYGKTNLDEFAMGSSTEHSAFGPTRNPFDRERVPGGSSGGSAAAVAAGIVPAALGSSTGGSVRQPAALCGVVGLKPTYGRVSRYGLVAFGSSLDQVGVLAPRVRDAARVLEVVAGHDPRDPTSRDRPVPRAEALEAAELEGKVLGLPDEYLDADLHPGLRSRLEGLAGELADAGARVRRVGLPTTPHAVPCYQVVSTAEASSNLARFDGVRFGRREEGEDGADALYRASRGRGLGEEVKRRIMLGTCALSAGRYEDHYLRARRARRAVARDLLDALDEVDVLLAPTAAGPAFRLGERTDDPYEMYRSDRFTVAANLAGIPAVSVPAGLVEGLPVGLQLMAPPWEEEEMLGLAAGLEELIGFERPAPA